MNSPALLQGQRGCVTSCVIVGRRSLQNELLVRLIQERQGIHCAIAEYNETDLLRHFKTPLVMFDAVAFAGPALEGEIYKIIDASSVIAIFNVSPDLAINRLLRCPSLKGLFYKNANEEQFLKGVRSLCLGELWLPRNIMAEYFGETRKISHLLPPTGVVLTPKEKQILYAMISGARNMDIAQSLHVSPHTIKTHIYNMFRKIKVANRVQAVSWAMENLERQL